MNQTTIFIILFALAGVSLLMTAIVWLYQLSLVSKINEIEQEIEKKAQEFDIIKKEHNTIPHPQPIISFPDESVQEPAAPDYSSNSSLDNQIQIIRNVRGSFQTATDSPLPPHQAIENDTTMAAADPENEILDVVADNQQIHTPTMPVRIPLYSDTLKDADFNQLWQQISVLLNSGQKQNIIIDFAGINFLYDKELKYLLKIAQITASQGTNLAFSNIDQDLKTIMQNYPPLLSLTTLI